MNDTLGVLITNLGTPAAPTAHALRKYLSEFLGDSRVVEIPQPIWWLILHGIILRVRPKRSAELYQKIWTLDGSPLLVNSQKLVNTVQAQLAKEQNQTIKVVLGMRYGQPSLSQALTELQKAGCGKILILPLFPQYAAATTASIFDAVAKIFKKWRVIPELKLLTQYHANPAYITAIAESVRQHWQQHGQQHLLFSFHGLPQRCVDLGDPYQQQCLNTAQLITKQLELTQEQWSVVFQSRFGRAQWLQPYCDITLQKMPEKGIKNINVICPGFAVDCLETLEEINQLNRELFLKAGGKEFHYIPCLNASELQVNLIKHLIIEQMSIPH